MKVSTTPGIALHTFSSSRIDVSAPLASSASHAFMSAALTAKNKTGSGKEDALGSAPRSNSKAIVDFK